MTLKSGIKILATLLLRGIGSSIAVFFLVLVSRHLDTKASADFFLLFNIATISAICFRWGLDEVIVRRISNTQRQVADSIENYLIELSYRRISIWFIFSLIFSLSAVHLTKKNLAINLDSSNLVTALIASAFIALTACSARIFQGHGKTNLATVLLNIAVPSIALASLLLLIQIRAVTTNDLILVYTCAAAIVYISTLCIRPTNPLSTLYNSFKINWSNNESNAANKLGGVVLAQQAVIWTALLVIPYTHGDSAYKEFVVTQKIATLVSLIMLAINFTFARNFASLYAEGKLPQLRKLISYSLYSIILSSFIFTATLLSATDWVFAYSKIPSKTTNLLLILIASQVFFSISALFSLVLSMAHDDNYLFANQAIINCSGALLFVIASHYLSLELISSILVLSYFILSLTLGLRVIRLTSTQKTEKA